MKLFDGPDCLLNAEIIGNGDPITIFVHGITGSTDELAPLAGALRGTRVLLDLRGHGHSESPPETAGYDHYAMRRDLEAAADRFGATRAVGLSLGAGSMLNLLADRPDRFERIVLMSPASLNRPNIAATGLFLELARRLETTTTDEVIAWSLEGSRELVEREPKWGDLIRRRVVRMNATGVPRALRGYVHGAPPLRDINALTRITIPALVLGNENDPIHNADIARTLASLLPNASIQIWPEALGMFDDQDALARMIAEFLT